MTDYTIFDIETNDLEGSNIYCLCYKKIKRLESGSIETTAGTIIQYSEMRSFLLDQVTLIGHNIIRFDIPILERKLEIKIEARLIDTLAVSWYLYPERHEHGLESWGETLGRPKPRIADWNNLTIEEYVYRCSEDVEINTMLFIMSMEYLMGIYDKDIDQVIRLLGYLAFKLDCAREQEEMKWRLDIKKCQQNLDFLLEEKEKKAEILRAIMPKVVQYDVAKRPKVMHKKDGEISEHGKRWLEKLKIVGLPEHHVNSFKYPNGEEEIGNPNSSAQLKKWLFSLGWIPETYVLAKQSDGTMKKIPQINTKDDGICPSIPKMYDEHPELEHLEGYSTLTHRIGMLNGFLASKDEDNCLIAGIQGLTNTLRFQHVKPLANIPQVPKAYWEKVRECLITPDDDHILCGSDMAGLEDQTKRHYMWFYDPEYVKEMMSPDFDPHCDIAVIAGMMTREEAEFYRIYSKKKDMSPAEMIKFADIKGRRLRAKRVNFGGIYGAGAPKLALTGGFSLDIGKKFYKAYWKRNYAVKSIARACKIKTIGTKKWLHNPVSRFWYSLREEKDAFSTLNQGTGVYCFDTWVRNVRKQGIRICGQFHDEHVEPVLKEEKELHSIKLKNAIQWTNDELQLNVTLGISIDFGYSYKDIH